MIDLDADDDDDVEFVEIIGILSGNIRRLHSPETLIILKMDNWFGPKWLKFSNKFLGAVGIWHNNLRIPPFVPSRILWERRYSPINNVPKTEGPRLHLRMSSSDASQRKLAIIAPNTAIVWFSGQTHFNRRGSVMCYIQSDQGQWAWYTGWKKQVSWIATTHKGISAAEVSALLACPPGSRGD